MLKSLVSLVAIVGISIVQVEKSNPAIRNNVYIYIYIYIKKEISIEYIYSNECCLVMDGVCVLDELESASTGAQLWRLFYHCSSAPDCV